MENDITKMLKSKFEPKCRYDNFGSCINSIKINGFRGVSCDVTFEYPVIAVTGLNGAGKSTLCQLLLCAYKSPSDGIKRSYIMDFFPVSVLDRNPFQRDASVEYEYQTPYTEKNISARISRSSDSTRWRGYNLQPEKQAIYIGLNFYLPKIERRDLTIYTNRITKTDRIDDMDIGVSWVAKILGQNYDEVYIQAVKGTQREAQIGMAKRLFSEYSENNMGFGEGRMIHIVRLLETCAQKSLIILEEPETSLHEFAQNQFAKYLIDVSLRRGHQIILSTHSSAIIESLPADGRIMLFRDETGVTSYSGMSSMYLRNALSGGKQGHLVVCVEDKFANLFLSEIIRK